MGSTAVGTLEDSVSRLRWWHPPVHHGQEALGGADVHLVGFFQANDNRTELRRHRRGRSAARNILQQGRAGSVLERVSSTWMVRKLML